MEEWGNICKIKIFWQNDGYKGLYLVELWVYEIQGKGLY